MIKTFRSPERDVARKSTSTRAFSACCHPCCISQEAQSAIHRFTIGKQAHEILLDQHQVRSDFGLPVILAPHAALERGKIVFLPQTINCLRRLFLHIAYVPIEWLTAR